MNFFTKPIESVPIAPRLNLLARYAQVKDELKVLDREIHDAWAAIKAWRTLHPDNRVIMVNGLPAFLLNAMRMHPTLRALEKHHARLVERWSGLLGEYTRLKKFCEPEAAKY